MPIFKLPLSGDVNQNINPFTAFFAPMGGQYGLINISLGLSKDPAIEQDVLTDVGSYGRQLGRIGDALKVLIDRLPSDPPLKPNEAEAIEQFLGMLSEIESIKARRAMR